MLNDWTESNIWYGYDCPTWIKLSIDIEIETHTNGNVVINNKQWKTLLNEIAQGMEYIIVKNENMNLMNFNY